MNAEGLGDIPIVQIYGATRGHGSDTAVLSAGESTNPITDFEVGTNFTSLAGGLSFSRLTFSRLTLSSNAIEAGNEVLVTLSGIDTATLSADSFATV